MASGELFLIKGSVIARQSIRISLKSCLSLDKFTRKIREEEKATGRTLPIIAVTASALAAETEKCYQVGMNGFLSKPVELSRLKTTLEQYLPEKDATAFTPPPSVEKTPPPEPVSNGSVGEAMTYIRVETLQELVGDDSDTIKEILGNFPEPALEIKDELVEALEAGDVILVGQAGHKLKSAARSIGADQLADLCESLENVGKANKSDGLDEMVSELKVIMDHVLNDIEEFRSRKVH